MKIGLFDYKPYDKIFFQQANRDFNFSIEYFPHKLQPETARGIVDLDVVCVFVNDDLNRQCIEILRDKGVKLIALRCAGYNNVDIQTASNLGIKVVRVPSYSPQAVAEHALAMILSLNRKIHKAYARVREGNFSLNGLLGFNLQGKSVGIVGTGNIGAALAKLLSAMDVNLLACDPQVNEQCRAWGVQYVGLSELFKRSHIISLHCPLTAQTHHLIDEKAIAQMQDGVMLINTSRGAVIDSPALIQGLKTGKIGYLGMDVYEQEGDLFFEDLSCQIIQDDVFERLLTFPNVLITGHQGFFTHEALEKIAYTTLNNIAEFNRKNLVNQVLETEVKQCVTHSW